MKSPIRVWLSAAMAVSVLGGGLVTPVTAASTHTWDPTYTGAIVRSHATASGYCDDGARHYAVQWTATDNGGNHTNCDIGLNSDPGPGWIGVNGQISTPSTAPSLNEANQDHNNGWIGAYWMNEGPDEYGSFIQIGWYSGLLGDPTNGCPVYGQCIKRYGSYGMYVEFRRLNGSTYITDLGNLSLGQKVTYNVQMAGGCWNAYYNYNQFAAQACGLPSFGPMWAVNELYTRTGTGHMGSSEFGTAALNTNQTLRLQGGCYPGWENWDQSLCSGGTRYSDVRYPGLPHNGSNYVISAAHLWWDMLTYQY